MPSLSNLSYRLMKTYPLNQLTSRNYLLGTMLLPLWLGSPAPLAQAEDCAVSDQSTIAAGGHLLSPAETADHEQRYTLLFQAALRAASASQTKISFWSAPSALGGSVVHNGRFREFYVSETVVGRTIWFRDTSGPEGQFPRTRLQYQSPLKSTQGVVTHGFYLAEGQPVRTPHDVALNTLRENCDFWLDLLAPSDRSQMAIVGK